MVHSLVLRLSLICVLVVGIAAIAPAQTGYSAIATSGMAVHAENNVQSIPPNTDVSSGASLRITGPLSSAQLDLKLGFAGEALYATLSANAAYRGNNPFLLSTAKAQTITLTVQTPLATRAIVTTVFSGSLGFPASGSFSVDAGSAGLFVYGVPLFSSPPVTKEWKVLVTPQGFALRFSCDFAAGTGMGGFGSISGTCNLLIRADPDYPCRALQFGSTCGASLVASGGLLHPGTTLFTLTDQGLPLAAWFLIGDQKTHVPLPGGCVLYDNLLVLLPAALTSTGVASVRVVPPPIPNLYFVVQGATWDGAELRMSQGLEVFCN